MYLDNELGMGNPVMVGVDYKEGTTGNYDKITDHWVVITARRHDEKGVYYTYMEVGQRSNPNQTTGDKLGTSTDKNRFYFDPTGNYLVGIDKTVSSRGEIPIVTIIRGETMDKCCGRTPYVKNEKMDSANRLDKENADGIFIVIHLNKLSY
jgi:hypothetical protein